MNKAQLKEIVSQLDAAGVPDSALIKVEIAIDNSRIDLAAMPFIIEGQDASFSVDASDHWASSVLQESAVILKQG